MARAVWKGPFVEESLMKKVDKYKIDPKKIPVLVWNLDHLTSKQISDIEKEVIKQLYPYCNTETYKKRQKNVK